MATTTTTTPTLGEVLDAVELGDVDTIRRWIDGGGDPNMACSGTVTTPLESTYYETETPLMVAAMVGKVDVVRTLVQAGADVNITRPALSALEEQEGTTESALTLALVCAQPEIAQVLLDLGADKTAFQRMAASQTIRTLGDHRILRMFFIAGVDILAHKVNNTTFDEVARNRLAAYTTLTDRNTIYGVYAGPREQYAKVVEVIDGVRLAGSYREFILHEYKQLLRVRSLLARSRATMAPETPEVIQRLFSGIATVPTRRRSRAPPKRSAGVPDPVFWKVLEYYRLGDWRRPGTLPKPWYQGNSDLYQ